MLVTGAPAVIVNVAVPALCTDAGETDSVSVEPAGVGMGVSVGDGVGVAVGVADGVVLGVAVGVGVGVELEGPYRLCAPAMSSLCNV